MKNIYDIILNFNNELLECYEWTDEDKLFHIKRTTLMRINEKLMIDLASENVKLDKKILDIIKNKTESFEEKKSLKYSCIFSEGKGCIAVIMNDNAEVIKKSRLLLDEETEVSFLATSLKQLEINYEKNNNLKKENYKKDIFLTRTERIMKRKLAALIKKIDSDSNKSKYIYIYYEYFNKKENIISKIQSEFLNEITKGFNIQKIYDLFNSVCKNNV